MRPLGRGGSLHMHRMGPSCSSGSYLVFSAQKIYGLFGHFKQAQSGRQLSSTEAGELQKSQDDAL